MEASVSFLAQLQPQRLFPGGGGGGGIRLWTLSLPRRQRLCGRGGRGKLMYPLLYGVFGLRAFGCLGF